MSKKKRKFSDIRENFKQEKILLYKYGMISMNKKK